MLHRKTENGLYVFLFIQNIEVKHQILLPHMCDTNILHEMQYSTYISKC